MNPAQSIPLTKKQIAIACAVCLISAFALGALAFTAFPTSAGFLKSERTNGFWFPLADGISNAYHMWRLDPFSLLASYFTDFSHWSGAFSPIQVFLFSAGSWSLFFSFTATVQFFKRAALITLGTWSLSTLLLILFGQNSVVWGSLMWLPFSILALSTAQLYWRTEHSNKPLLLISVVLCSLLIYFSANQLAWLVSALTLLIVYFAHEDLSDRSNSNALFHEKLWIIILLVPAIWGLFSAPIADFPDYPSTSHLVPDDGLAGLTRPLIGKDYPLAVINRAGLKKLLMPYSLSALILLPLSWLIIRRSHYRAFYMITFLLSILLVLDILLPEHFSQISPLSAISRMLPGVSMMSLAPIILALLIFSFI